LIEAERGIYGWGLGEQQFGAVSKVMKGKREVE